MAKYEVYRRPLAPKPYVVRKTPEAGNSPAVILQSGVMHYRAAIC